MIITDKCNLQCKHCAVYDVVGGRHRPFEDIISDLQYSYQQGSRFVDLEGGETTLWKDGEKDLNDIIAAARQIGFFSVTITTNAQQDFCWVSMDGIGAYHEVIRGNGTFNKLEKNIASFHRSRKNNCAQLSVNMVVNKLNINGLEEALEYAQSNPAIGQIAINFHTPFPGTEHLMLSDKQKAKALDTVIRYKHKGYPIMNSYLAYEKCTPHICKHIM